MKKMISTVLAAAAVVFLVSGLFAEGDAFYKIMKIDEKKQTITVNEWDISNKPVGKSFVIKITADTMIMQGEKMLKFNDLKKDMQIELTYKKNTKKVSMIMILN